MKSCSFVENNQNQNLAPLINMYFLLIDVDECAEGIVDCGEAACINTPGDYDCVCDSGYELNGDGLNCTSKPLWCRLA